MKNQKVTKLLKKKPFLTLVLFSLIVASLLGYNTTQKLNSNYKEKEEAGQDGPDEAAMQNFLMTQDPKLGYPPSERMRAVRALIENNSRMGHQGGQCITWDERGPGNVGGRTRALMYDPNDASHDKVWAGGVSGGLWYTDNIHDQFPVWVKVNDLWDNLAVTCIVSDPLNPNNFYAGTGEGFFQETVDHGVRGAGIWFSDDGGANWDQLPTTDIPQFYFIQKIAVAQNGKVYIATRTGVYSSDDYGVNWTPELVAGTTVGDAYALNTTQIQIPSAADIEFGADGTVYASLGLINEEEGAFRRLPASPQWERITTPGSGFPAPPLHYCRIELAAAPSDQNIIYASVAKIDLVQSAPFGTLGLWRSIDKGVHWTQLSCAINDQAWYDLTLTVDPLNSDALCMNSTTDIWRSITGGQSWALKSTVWPGPYYVHADQQIFVHEPGLNVQDRLLVGSDGGVFYTDNLQVTTVSNFADKNGLSGDGYRTAQFYSCAIHPSAGSNFFMGGTQDNEVQIFNSPGIANTTPWGHHFDGGYCFIDENSAAGSAYIGSKQKNGFLLSSTGVPGSFGPAYITSDGTGRFINPADYDYRFHSLYAGTYSDEIERVDNLLGIPNPPIPIPITNMITKASFIKVSPYININGNSTVFVGTGPEDISNTDGGRLFRIDDANTSTPITNQMISPQAGNNFYISCIEIGATDNDILLTYSNYGESSVFETHNGGVTWFDRDIGSNLPDMPIRWALYNPLDRKEVLLATESGVWLTNDINRTPPDWVEASAPIARTRVDMLRYRASDKMVLAATHGRGLFSTCYFNHPIADFSFPATVNCLNLTVSFTDNSTNGATSWEWDFGDGTTSNVQNPTHTYVNAGNYTVSLTATNGCGCNVMRRQVGVGPWAKQVSTDMRDEHGGDVCTDISGNIYITCSYTGVFNLDGIQFGTPGQTNLYVAMFNRDGQVQWVTPINTSALGIAFPVPQAIHLDPARNAIYIAASGIYDIYFARLNLPGGALVWEKHFSQLTNLNSQKFVTGAYDICTDVNGYVYLAGSFGGGIRFDGSNIVNPTNPAGVDFFVARYTSAGIFNWVNNGIGAARGIVYNTPLNQLIITGANQTNSILFNCYDSNGNFLWSRIQGTGSKSYGKGIDADINGNLYLTGYFNNIATFGPTVGAGYLQVNSNGAKDIFVAQYNSLGLLKWVNSYGGLKDDEGKAIYSDDYFLSIFLTGSFSGNVIFPPGPLIANGPRDIFTCEIKNYGFMPWVSRYGGTGDADYGNGIFSDFNAGAVYEIGDYTNNATFGISQLNTTASVNSAYLKKICLSAPTMKMEQNPDFQSSEINELLMKVFPAPAYDWINVEVSGLQSQKIRMTLYDTQGSLLWSKLFETDKTTFNYRIDLTTLPQGLYVIKVSDSNSSSSSKFIRM